MSRAGGASKLALQPPFRTLCLLHTATPAPSKPVRDGCLLRASMNFLGKAYPAPPDPSVLTGDNLGLAWRRQPNTPGRACSELGPGEPWRAPSFLQRAGEMLNKGRHPPEPLAPGARCPAGTTHSPGNKAGQRAAAICSSSLRLRPF